MTTTRAPRVRKPTVARAQAATAKAVTVPSSRSAVQAGTFDVTTLQGPLGNQTVSRLIASGALGTGVIQRRGGKNRRRNRNASSGPSGSGSTAVAIRGPSGVVPYVAKPVTVPIPQAAVTKTPEVVKEAETSDPGETVGALAGGVLDIWEGLETATDSSKTGIERGGGVAKAGGGSSALFATAGKSLEAISDSTADLAGTVTEACGFLASAAECIAAVKAAYEKSAWDAFMEFGKNLGSLVVGALKTVEAYTKFAEKSETFKAWISEGVIPGLSIVTGAYKAIQKVHELYELSTRRLALIKKLKTLRDVSMRSSTQHLVSMLDSKWYKGAIELISTTADLTGEAMKWSAWGIGWVTGSAVSASSKLLPLGAKVANWVWQTALDWGATSVIGGKTTLQIQTDTEALADMIVARHSHAFGKLLCETIGIDQSEAGDRDAVLQALAALG